MEKEGGEEEHIGSVKLNFKNRWLISCYSVLY